MYLFWLVADVITWTEFTDQYGALFHYYELDKLVSLVSSEVQKLYDFSLKEFETVRIRQCEGVFSDYY